MDLQITNIAPLEELSPDALNRQLASVSRINELTAQQAAQFSACIWAHNERHAEFWRANDDEELEAILNAVGIAALTPIFTANMAAAQQLNALAELVGIADRALIAPLREISVNTTNGKISVLPQAQPTAPQN